MFTANNNYGVITYDISNISNVHAVFTITRESPLALRLSEDNQFLFLAEGTAGFTIIDSSDPKNLVIISKLKMNGWVSSLCITNSSDYAFITMINGNSLALVDIRNKLSP